MRNESSLRVFDALSRREFARRAGGCSAMTSISMMSTLLGLRATNSLAAGVGSFGEDDYKALVCVFMFGGNDSFNTIVPNENEEFEEYRKKRSNMALRQETLLPITGHDGRQFGFHPSLEGLRDLYNDGKVACVANVGSLIEPTTSKDYKDENNLPLGLYSHSDFQRHWQTGVPQERSGLVGWAGRIADVLTDATNENMSVSMNFGLDDSPVLLTGAGVLPYVVDKRGAIAMADYQRDNRRGRIITNATDAMLSQTYSNLLKKTHATTRRNAIDAAMQFNEATKSTDIATRFPRTSLGDQLAMVAKIIGSRKTLNQKRQIFFVSRGGFDNHNELINSQARLLTEFDEAITAFQTALRDDLNIEDRVTTFTASDFARTLSSNGNGTDHAWGGNHFMIGGAVNGGRLYGQYPTSLRQPRGIVSGRETSLQAGTSRGRLIPTTSVDEYNAELAIWFGVPDDDSLKIVLPNVENFMKLRRGAPLGILS